MLLFWTICIIPVSLAAADPRSTSSFYLRTFGSAENVEDVFVSRAHRVFARLMNVVDKAKAKDPDLLVIDSSNWPWAIALPDNTVVLTRGALELCYKNVSPAVGDARIAMVLGHELAHLAEDDYWHRDIYLALSENENMRGQEVFSFIGQRSGFGSKTDDTWLDTVRDREIRADDNGFLYAALAGFDVEKIINLSGQSFFQHWKSKTNNVDDGTHLSAHDRTAFISARYLELANLSEAFYLGLGLIHFEYLDLAEQIFKYILTRFPSHEIYNNLGYINFLQSGALSKTAADKQFWLPTIVEDKPSTIVLTRGIGATAVIDQEKLDKSAYYFSQAVANNPGYLEASLNLATANFYLGKFNRSISVLREIEAQHPDNPAIKEIMALARYRDLQGKVDLRVYVTDILKSLIAANPSSYSVRFNLAQLYSSWGQKELAEPLWQQFRSAQGVPEPYRSKISKHLGSALPRGDDNKHYREIAASLPSRTPIRKAATLMRLPNGDRITGVDHGNGITEYRDNVRTLFTRYRRVVDSVPAQFAGSFTEIRGKQSPSDSSLHADTSRNALLFQRNSGAEIWLRD